MARINVKGLNVNYYKPVISKNHNLTWKWLLNEGYTVKYLSLCLNIRIEDLSGYFREPNKFTIHHINVIILLLKDIKTPIEILKALLFKVDATNTKENENLKQIYETIVLPPASRSTPVHRLDYELKKPKDNH